MMNMESEALKTIRERAHRIIDENAQLEMDLLDVKLEKLLSWSKEIYEVHLENLYFSRAESLIDKLKIMQYKFNIQMYGSQLEAQKYVPSLNGTEK